MQTTTFVDTYLKALNKHKIVYALQKGFIYCSFFHFSMCMCVCVFYPSRFDWHLLLTNPKAFSWVDELRSCKQSGPVLR